MSNYPDDFKDIPEFRDPEDAFKDHMKDLFFEKLSYPIELLQIVHDYLSKYPDLEIFPEYVDILYFLDCLITDMKNAKQRMGAW